MTEKKISAKDQKIIEEYAQLQRTIKELNERRLAIYQDVVEAMKKNELMRRTTEHGSVRLFVKQYRHFDVEVAEEVLSEEMFEDLTERRVVSGMVDARLKTGELDPKLVEKFCTTDMKMELRLY